MQSSLDKLREMFGDPEWTKQFSNPDQLLRETMEWVRAMQEKQFAHEERMTALQYGEPMEGVGASWAAALTAFLVPLVAFTAACGALALLGVWAPDMLNSLGLHGIIWGVAGAVSFFAVVESISRIRPSRKHRHKGRQEPPKAIANSAPMERVEQLDSAQ